MNYTEFSISIRYTENHMKKTYNNPICQPIFRPNCLPSFNIFYPTHHLAPQHPCGVPFLSPTPGALQEGTQGALQNQIEAEQHHGAKA